MKVVVTTSIVAALVIVLLVVVGVVRRGSDGGKEISLVLEKNELYSGQRTLAYTLVNNSSEKISIGEPYDMQQLRNGEWVSVEWIKDYVWSYTY